METNKFTSTFSYKLIYIFRINDKIHSGKLKLERQQFILIENWENCNLIQKN